MRENINFGVKGKHCHNCIHLEWMEAEMYDPAGFICNKRVYSSVKAEDDHLFQLENENYRFKSKKCFESKS